MGIIYTIEKATETLDKAIDCIEKWNSIRCSNGSINLVEQQKAIPIEKDIHQIAKVLGIELTCEVGTYYKWYSFEYRGYIVHQYEGVAHEQ